MEAQARSVVMIRAEQSGIIDRPIEEVFAFIGDQTNTPQWQAGLVEVRRTTEGPIGVGTKHTFVRTFMRRRLEADNEYVAYEPNKLITFKTTTGPVRLLASYLFEAVAGGTRVTSRVEMDASGFMSLAEPLIAAGLKREMKAASRLLKDLLENQARAIASQPATP
jgi:uncharacterized protein YndB with AHSA1/START domain